MIDPRRLRTLTWAEIAWRARTGIRTTADRWRHRVSPERWRREELRSHLSPSVPPAVISALRQGAWNAAHDALGSLLHEATLGLLPSSATPAGMRKAVIPQWPLAAEDATRRADNACAGRLDVLAYRGLPCRGENGRIDWRRDPVGGRRAPSGFAPDVPYLAASSGDHKVIWEINRQQHLLVLGRAAWLTGDARYTTAAVADILDWMEANPPLHGVNWSSMLELAFRTISWLWTVRFTRDVAPRLPDDAPWRVDLLLGLTRQWLEIERHLSYYFSPNTHLTGEALALYVAGRLFPWIRHAARWEQTGRTVLLQEIDRQVSPDGGHVERSTHYHRYTLDFYLLAWLVASRTGDPAAARFLAVVERLARTARAFANDRGLMPTIGDDDGGRLWPFLERDPADVRDSLTLAALVLDDPGLACWGPQEEACWLWGPDAASPMVARATSTPTPAPSVLLRQTGYAVLRDTGSHLVFDVGPHGYLNGGHAHADPLAVTLDVDGHRLLIDPGTASYTANPALRDRFRRSQQHNTLTLGDVSAALPRGPFHWQTRVDATAGDWHAGPDLAWATGWHDGYAGVRHARSVLQSSGGGWLVVDWLDPLLAGRGASAAGHPRDVSLHWHLAPEWTLTSVDTHRLLARRGDAPDTGAIWMLHDSDTAGLFLGDEDTGLGWCSLRYGDLRPTWTARLTSRADLPLTRACWFGRADEWRTPTLRRLAAPRGIAAFEVIANRRRLSAAVRRPSAPEPRPARLLLPGMTTDAALLQQIEDGDQLRLDALQVSTLLSTDPRLPHLRVPAPLADLALLVSAGRLACWTSTPPAEMTIAAGGRLDISLNGRDCPGSGASAPRRIQASDWGAPDPTRSTPCAA